ncbi:MAG: AAA family ATPase, partial [Rhodospirillaceae bacterium]|nr:AAA family ATPase [Rhodospirillaceae bacterium]
FDQETLFDKLAARGALGESQVIAAVEAIARFHAAAERAPGGAATIARIIDGNRDSMMRAAVPRPLAAARAEALDAACRALLERRNELLNRRGREGRVRDGHGDLHLRNICLVEGKPVLFDAIEFDPGFRRIDVFYDFAFLLMDLLHRRLPHHANRALNAYVGASDDGGGMATLPLFLGLRAIIRGHIQATIAGGGGDAAAWAEAGAYFDLAEAALAPPPPVMVAVGGLSGTGKTTIARAIAPALGALPGALLLRSDVLRKRLAGAAETDRLDQAYYSAEWSARVYAEIKRQCGEVLAQGQAVVADAVSGATAQRRELEAVARAAGARFAGIWLEAPLAVREERVGARRGDASDADAAVARRQREPEVLDWIKVDASGELPETVAAVEDALRDAGIPLRAD